jgi:hypothetical protein
MNCSGIVYSGDGAGGGLAYTGSPLAFLMAVALVCLGLGLLALLAGRRRRVPLGLAVLLVLAVTFATGVVGSSSASASPYCQDAGQDAIAVSQTSVNDDLAPGVAPSLITGRLVNTTEDALYITQVVVSISAVTKTAAASGTCDVSDYVLLDPSMAVGQLIEGRGSATFSGARIGFNDKSVDQDACRGATLTLTYVAS